MSPSSDDPKDTPVSAPEGDPKEEPGPVRRRRFLQTAARVGMAGGLLAGYGAFAAAATRYLYPAEGPNLRWVFVAETGGIRTGTALFFRGPQGETINIARLGDEGTLDDFIALSSVCPHLGCQVHWEEENDRFFCPCHAGVFDPSGVATAGPPAKAGQRLARYRLKIESGLLYIEVSFG